MRVYGRLFCVIKTLKDFVSGRPTHTHCTHHTAPRSAPAAASVELRRRPSNSTLDTPWATAMSSDDLSMTQKCVDLAMTQTSDDEVSVAMTNLEMTRCVCLCVRVHVCVWGGHFVELSGA
jgi:hypothetical protein